MVIPKYPEVPYLTKKQIEEITEITFLKESTRQQCDAIFGSHPGNWQAPLHAYQQGLGAQIIITGGTSLHGMKHPNWN
ncbi:hypothetical protein E0M25_09030 [Bacillus mycoides]|nr:hypothetical protein IKO_02793 [Bacillus cereus VDM034]EJS14722.1 hypothetical protein IKS_02318 [Bacillus cereus VDM062]MBG9688981.1 hypothetical protein [Bacillus mycoides]PRD10583.1 hypothetical protein CQ058_08485 [Bacillus sp. MYb56]QWG34489.1 hypothetical protein EXW30_16845 [Bacillus mycoides]